MITIGLIREGKTPADNRVALTPSQCKSIEKKHPGVRVKVQSAPGRCFSDAEYRRAGIEVVTDLVDADVLLGIKEVPVEQLVAGKTYLFFSHTKKKQPHNRKLLQTILEKKIRLIDYECLLHDDGQRIIGFGFFAGIVGAHNGMMVYGHRTGTYNLGRVHEHRSFRKLMHTYFGLHLPNVKVVVTGSGRVAHGALEIMNLMQIREVEKEEFLERDFSYPVYVHLKGSDLYHRADGGNYSRGDFHAHPAQYASSFGPYTKAADILMNGVYWDNDVPRLFEENDVRQPGFRIQVIADVTDDTGGSVPINLGDQTIEDPVYGVDKKTLQKTAPYLPSSIDVMAVGNLPNELPRDASRYFGEQLLKFVLPDLLKGGSSVISRATMAEGGNLSEGYAYLEGYVAGED
ncbi:MAG: alanine dehydrogenase [Chitinophagaceae bacterium]|nr:MAG: alanine dehydrogenase [Chitinophagaceae bacterium]